MQLRGARVALTGAGGGIGAAGALAFARSGARLALAGRTVASLEAMAERCRAAGSPEVLVHRVDVTRDEDVRTWAEALGAQWGALDVCVANAGVGHYGAFAAFQPEHLEQLVQTNILGVWRTVQAFLPLLAKAQGHAIVVGSAAGAVAIPYLSAYCATKSAMLGWTRAVRPELRRQGVTLTLLAPGATRTGFARNALREVPGVGKAEAAPEGTLDRFLGLLGQNPAAVGRAMVHSARWRRREVTLTLPGRAGVLLAHAVPLLLPALAEPLMRPRPGGGGVGKWKH